jgi:purine-cytosine permease-like protein
MKNRYSWTSFAIGVFVALCLFVGARYFPAASKSASYYLWIAGCVMILMLLPRIFVRAKREAVPSKRSDLIGYVAILAFCASLYFVARAMID